MYFRLQNSPYFCVFKYARAVKQKVWNEAENRERDWGETLVRFACVRLLRHSLPISLLILRKKLFCSLSVFSLLFNASHFLDYFPAHMYTLSVAVPKLRVAPPKMFYSWYRS